MYAWLTFHDNPQIPTRLLVAHIRLFRLHPCYAVVIGELPFPAGKLYESPLAQKAPNDVAVGAAKMII